MNAIDYTLMGQLRLANERLRRAYDTDDRALAQRTLVDMVNDATKMLVLMNPANKPFENNDKPASKPQPATRTRSVGTTAPTPTYASGKAQQFPWKDHPALERELIEAFLTGTLPSLTMIKKMMSSAAGFEVTDGHWRNKIHNHRPPQFIYDRVARADQITWETLWVAGAYLMRHDPVEGARKGDQWIRHIALYLGRHLSCGEALPVFSRKEVASVNALVRLALPSQARRAA